MAAVPMLMLVLLVLPMDSAAKDKNHPSGAQKVLRGFKDVSRESLS
jgi:hypothetical protein